MTDTAEDAPHQPGPTATAAPSRRRVVIAAAIGNFMEWFDFGIYGFFAVSIGATFFPSGDPTASLLSALAVYGVAFLVRPIGGVVIGSIGDRFGRRRALSLSVVLMGSATALIALLPSYATAGVVAPVLLVALRCVQGFSAGGEWTGSTAYVVENAPPGHRARYASVISATAGLAVAAAASTAVLISVTLPPAAVDDWGWRIPFLAALPLTLVGLYIRLRLADTPVFDQLKRTGAVESAPLRAVGRHDLRSVGITFALSSVTILGFYYLATYATTFLLTVGGFDRLTAYTVVATGAAVYAALCLAAGVLADRYGRRPLSRTGGVGLTLVAVPAFLLMASGDPVVAVLGFVLFAVFEALHNVTTTVVLIELFPASTRATGSATGFNLAAALVAGPGPLIAAALATTGLGAGVPALYITAVALLATAAVWRFLPETRDRSISDAPLHR